MNAPPPVILTSTSPVIQGQQVLPVQQGMTSQPQVVVIQGPSSPPLEMGSCQRGCVVGMGAIQLTIGILFFIVQIGAFISPTHDIRCTRHMGWNFCEYLYQLTNCFPRKLVVQDEIFASYYSGLLCVTNNLILPTIRAHEICIIS